MGIDLHRKYFVATIVDEDGKVTRRDRVSTDRLAIANYLESLDGEKPGKAVMEACYNWSYLYDQLEGEFDKVLLAHPLKTKAIAEARIKNDKLDSETLAQLLRADLIAQAYAPPRETRDVKNLLRYRASIVGARTAFKNRVHAVLARNHVENPALRNLSDIFGKKGMAIMRRLELYGHDTAILNGLLDIVEEFSSRERELKNQIRAMNRQDDITRLLMTIPGIGDITALLIRYEIDDIDRFLSPGKLCSYAGIVPATDSSGGKTYHGRITGQGNRWLRWGIIEASHKATVTSPSLSAYHARIKARRCSSDGTVALARKLLKIVYYVWKEGRPYYEGRVKIG
jgi:transposase